MLPSGFLGILFHSFIDKYYNKYIEFYSVHSMHKNYSRKEFLFDEYTIAKKSRRRKNIIIVAPCKGVSSYQRSCLYEPLCPSVRTSAKL